MAEFIRYRATVPDAGPVFVVHRVASEDGRQAQEAGAAQAEPARRLQVGFFVKYEMPVDPTCRLEHWPERTVARCAVDGPAWRTGARAQEFIRRLRDDGKDPEGIVIEWPSGQAVGQDRPARVMLEASLRSVQTPHNSPPLPETTLSEERPAALTGKVPDPVEPAANPLRDQVLDFLDRIRSGRNGTEEAPWLGRGNPEGVTRAGVDKFSGVRQTAGQRFLAEDFKAVAEQVLPPTARYGRARRIDVARVINALDEAGAALSGAHSGTSREFIRVVKALRQQASRIRLDVPDLASLDVRSQLRLIDAEDDLGLFIRALEDAVRTARSEGSGISECRNRAATLLDRLERIIHGE